MTSSPSADSPERAGPGAVVGGRYTLQAAVGHGGMGTVWRATDNQLHREVAVKEVVPPPGIAPADREAMYQRTVREARAAAVVSHPAVVQVYDVVTDGGRPWIVMELLDARSLAEMVLSDGPLAPRAIAKIGVAMLGALEMAHSAGVLHRDVKPANVLICADGRCVLTDFGVARMPTDQELTTPGMVLGSPHFISPERALGKPFGPPSDLFSLGVTLYVAVEGRPPFDKGEPISTMHAVVEEPPRPPERADALTEVLYGLLEKDPSQRWDAATARQVLRELLAGPLASRTPQFPTDPYSVVAAHQLPPPAPPPAAVPQVGGRALVGPDDDPYQALPDAYGQLPDPYRRGDPVAPRQWTPLGDPSDRPPPAPRSARSPRSPQVARAARVAKAGAVASRGPASLLSAARRLPRRAQVGIATGVTAAMLISALVAFNGGGDRPDDDTNSAGGGPNPTAGPTTQAKGDEPSFPVQQYADRGIVVNLPQDWREAGSTEIYVDFVDQTDASAKVRLLVEPSGAGPRRFIEIIEPNVERNCVEAGFDPYTRVSLNEIALADRAAAQLEYTCGQGDDARHALWATVVHDGQAYSFFLRAPQSQFEQRRVVFDELVRSFRFAA